jgi:hypothetical protein
MSKVRINLPTSWPLGDPDWSEIIVLVLNEDGSVSWEPPPLPPAPWDENP